jgi:hypothetical protein
VRLSPSGTKPIALIAGGDEIAVRAENFVDLGEVLRRHGDLAPVADALAEVVALHDEKGNLLPVESCRRLLPATTG